MFLRTAIILALFGPATWAQSDRDAAKLRRDLEGWSLSINPGDRRCQDCDFMHCRQISCFSRIDPKYQARRDAASALLDLGPAGYAALSEALASGGAMVRAAVVDVMNPYPIVPTYPGAEGSERLTAGLSAALTDRSWEVRYGAARALAEMGTKGAPAAAALEQAASREKDSGVADAVRQALARIRAAGKAATKDQAEPKDAAGLMAWLKSGDPDSRLRAARGLAKLGQAAAEAAPALFAALSDEALNGQIAAASVEALHAMGPAAQAEAERILTQRLPGRLELYPHVERLFARPIAPSLLQAMAQGLQDTEPRMRMAAVEALWSLYEGEAATVLTALSRAWQDEDADIRTAAAAAYVRAMPRGGALLRLPRGKELPFLRILREGLRLKRADVWRARALMSLREAMAMLRPEDADRELKLALPELIVLIEDQQEPIACQLVGRLGPEAASAVPALTNALGLHPFEGAQMAVIEALERIGAQAAPAIPRLLELSEHGSNSLRKRYRDAAQRIAGQQRR